MSRTKGWERPNLVCNAMEKTSNGRWKKGMTQRINNQVPALGLAHNFKCSQCESDGKSERMLLKEWSCNLSKIFS
jgi:hypothetical protein